MAPEPSLSRRTVVATLAASAAAVMLRPLSVLAQASPVTKPIPSTGERLPVVGLGSWITFNVGDDAQLRDECAAVMSAFFAAGGRMIDSSPMYGSSQAVIGYGLNKLQQARSPVLRRQGLDLVRRARTGPDRGIPEITGASGGSICCRCTISWRGRSIFRHCSP